MVEVILQPNIRINTYSTLKELAKGNPEAILVSPIQYGDYYNLLHSERPRDTSKALYFNKIPIKIR